MLSHVYFDDDARERNGGRTRGGVKENAENTSRAPAVAERVQGGHGGEDG